MLYLLGGAFLLGAIGGWVVGLLRTPRPQASPRQQPEADAQPRTRGRA